MNKIMFSIILLLMVLIIGCTTQKNPEGTQDLGWQTINANGKFSFNIPQGMKQEDVQPIDSFVQQYSGDDMSVTFDYGWYSDSLNGRGLEPEFWQMEEEIGGFNAKLIGYRLDGDSIKYYAGVSFRNIKNDELQPTHLTLGISYSNPKDKNTAMIILRSIRFS